jgi:hypothetical protein
MERWAGSFKAIAPELLHQWYLKRYKGQIRLASFPLEVPTDRFWLRGRLRHLPLCGIRTPPLSLLHTTALP